MSLSYCCGPAMQTVPYFQPGVSILKILKEALRRNGDHIIMIEGDTGERISSSELLQQSSRIATGLQQAGVSPGDVVVLCCDKSILAISLFLGIIFTGATAVLAPPPSADTIDTLTSGQVVKALFYDLTLGESVSQSVARMSPPPSLLGKTDMRDPVITSLLKSAQEFREYLVENVTNHVPVVFFTSGTTGLPKGVEISDLGAQLGGILFRPKIESLLVATPLYWYSALCFIMGSIIRKYSLILTNSKDAKQRLRMIEEYKIESFFCNMAGMIQFNNEPTFNDIDLSSVKQVLIGGETTLPSVARPFLTRVMKGRAQAIPLYGSTEAGMLCDLNVQDVSSMRVGLCGEPSPGVEFKILDDHGSLVKTGEMGTVLVKTMASKGYWRRDDLNRSFLDNEGFFETGDTGFVDDKGCIHILGRICDVINFRGTKISPALLEDLLMDHPAIKDAVVIGKPDPDDGQHPTAFVVLKQKYLGTVSDSDIKTYVEERVEDYMKLRGGVYFRDSLPRVSNGKVIRKFVTY